MILVGDNVLLGLLFYGFLAWSAGALVLVTFVLTLLYGSTYYDRAEVTGARAWGWVRRWRLWQLFRRCYRHRIKDAGFLQSSAGRESVPCLFAASPHGVNSWSFFLTFMAQDSNTSTDAGAPAGGWTQKLGKPHVAVLRWLLSVPVLRECLLAMGAVTVDASTIKHFLVDQRRNLALIPGGTREISPAKHVPLPNREGFLRLVYGLHQGAQPAAVDVAYVYLENEDRVYWTWGNEWRLRQWLLNTVGFTITPYIGPLPLRDCPLVSHIGPRHVFEAGESLETYIARWHAGVAQIKQRIAHKE